jgi:hypothetical protein
MLGSTTTIASELEDSSRKVIDHPYLSWFDFAVLGAYLMVMLGVGYYIKRKAPSFEEFLVAGRSMTTPILVCTLASTLLRARRPLRVFRDGVQRRGGRFLRLLATLTSHLFLCRVCAQP